MCNNYFEIDEEERYQGVKPNYQDNVAPTLSWGENQYEVQYEEQYTQHEAQGA